MNGNRHAHLEDEVRRVLRRNAPPVEVRQAARDAYSQRERDSAVLPLVFDSLIGSDDDDAIEDADATRALVFEDAGIRIEFQVLRQAVGGEERRRVVAKVEGPRVLTARIHTPSEELFLASDAQNRFVHDDVPRGPAALLVEVEGRPPDRRHTEWTVI